MNPSAFSWSRLNAVMVKEVIQMRRDRLTFAMMVLVPLLQLVLFGYAINSDPKTLPTLVNVQETGPFARALVAGLRNSSYFRVVGEVRSEAEAERQLATGDAQFVVTIPVGFEAALVRGERPAVLLEADATDPASASNAVAAAAAMIRTVFDTELTGPLSHLRGQPDPIDLRVHRRYNPEGISQYNIVPGLMGVILTMTMVMMTALAVTRERERGTMENLLAMPVRPLEVMVGKILPYIGLGYVQVVVIVASGRWLFGVPLMGSLTLLSAALLLFIASNLTVGFTFSTVAKNQLQAMQMSFFFFLPSILLSGFMFPFRGMPVWAQWIGELFPLTHFLRVVRGILLKGNGVAEIWPEMWPIIAFVVASAMLALKQYRQTLD
ncbi:ABC transporter permease [Magnetospirillum sp. 15-1]|uniref:ABC transporter permease n=1 Tax=Magnetospirillum sp. 15-1 TaxID=1979370 RepID=UPI000BBC29D1|nr:ABC transporter permease [Magnetospirillum sp. 15-1]